MSYTFFEDIACACDSNGNWHFLYYNYSRSDGGAATVHVCHGDKAYELTASFDGEDDIEKGEKLAILKPADFDSFFSSEPTEAIRSAISNAKLNDTQIVKFTVASIVCHYCFDLYYHEYSANEDTEHHFNLVGTPRKLDDVSISEMAAILTQKGAADFAKYVNEVE